MDTDKENAGQVEAVTLDGEKWVIGESLHKFDHKVSASFAAWIKLRIESLKLKNGIDYRHDDIHGYLFTIASAQRIIDYERRKSAPKPNPKKKNVDEYGLPILPPPKRHGPLINPFDFLGGWR
jgi:hypothetical protein